VHSAIPQRSHFGLKSAVGPMITVTLVVPMTLSLVWLTLARRRKNHFHLNLSPLLQVT
jgi:uncharacterized membrane-anchored protein